MGSATAAEKWPQSQSFLSLGNILVQVSKAWEAAPGVAVAGTSHGPELGVQPGLHLPSCPGTASYLCFARFSPALGPAFHTLGN